MGFFSSKPKPEQPVSQPSQPATSSAGSPVTKNESFNSEKAPASNQINQNQIKETTKAMNNGTVISEGTIVEGQLKIESQITIDGTVKGAIVSKGKVIIGANGKVEGDITCSECEINGKYNGNLKVQDMLYLKGNARVDGEISTGKLVIESGVQFNGKCVMGASAVQGAAPSAARPNPNAEPAVRPNPVVTQTPSANG